MFNYYWVDDHINVATDLGTNCQDAEHSLRHAMTTILGPDAVNEDKLSEWGTRHQALGLIFDTVSGTISMPPAKVIKATACVAAAYGSSDLSRTEYRSLLGRLRHVATCIRPARPFLQRLRMQERRLRRWQRVPVTAPMKQVLRWWAIILPSPLLNGVPMEYFHRSPEPAVVVEMDASDSGLCALIPSDRGVLHYPFSAAERGLIEATKLNPQVGFDINYRELLSCAFAVHTWGRRWASQRRPADPLLHVQFKIDNTSAVAWHNRMASCNFRAQTIVCLLGFWEVGLGLRSSAVHVAGADNRIADAGSRTNSGAAMASFFQELTSGWAQVEILPDIAELEATWHSISERILWSLQPTPSIWPRSAPGTPGQPAEASSPRSSDTPRMFNYN
ncbi:hypothetical protein PF008_g20738 [Phytophthora fragariae]|uniref:Uncharacterized protein n=1 Tax=Phytophthora fragariae TaxID=53985 RepID=A0A6G0QYW9_9STRA|nr:hypothetical protein PF008_g20738 [Phytophthora fragariae]